MECSNILLQYTALLLYRLYKFSFTNYYNRAIVANFNYYKIFLNYRPREKIFWMALNHRGHQCRSLHLPRERYCRLHFQYYCIVQLKKVFTTLILVKYFVQRWLISSSYQLTFLLNVSGEAYF